MATLASPAPRSPTRMPPRRWARKVERYCCLCATYFPLVFVYSITTWAIWVEASISFIPGPHDYIGKLFASWFALSSNIRRSRDWNSWNRPVHPSKLVIYYSCLYESRHNDQRKEWLQLSTYAQPSRIHEPDSQIERRDAIL